MAITRLKGQNFRAFSGSTSSNMSAFPEETNLSVTISGNMEDSTTKDSEGGWTEEQMTSKQWSVQVDHVDASVATLRALLTMFNSDSKQYVGWDQTTKTAGGQNRTPAENGIARSGQAILSDISIQANNRQTIQTSVQWQGSGALA
jgi:predicted secreted protein